MTALIVTGGEGPSPEYLASLAESADYVIAADSGLDAALAAGLSPKLVMGDFDSISDKKLLGTLTDALIMEYESAKDDTDTELAIEEAARRGFGHIVLCGGGGGRLDHLMGILELFKRPIRPSEWYTSGESVHLVDRGACAEFHVALGDTVSIFSLCPESRNMDSRGLKWPLLGLAWGPGKFGISNIALESHITIKAGTADLLVVLPLHIRRYSESS